MVSKKIIKFLKKYWKIWIPLVIALALFLSGTGKKVYTELIDMTVSQRIADIEKSYTSKMEELNKTINEKESRLKTSEQKINRLTLTIKKLERERENIKPPGDINETQKRFNALGYHPVIR